MAENFAENYRI